MSKIPRFKLLNLFSFIERAHTHTHTHTYIYIYIYMYMWVYVCELIQGLKNSTLVSPKQIM